MYVVYSNYNHNIYIYIYTVYILIYVYTRPDNTWFPEFAPCPFIQSAFFAGNGPLLCAIAVLGNSLLFHDFDNTSSVLIHL